MIRISSIRNSGIRLKNKNSFGMHLGSPKIALILNQMAGNTLGTLFRLTTFGESHGKAIGGIIDGCPPGLEIDVNAIQLALARRRPGQSNLTTQRNEQDQIQILSGVFEGKSTGAPIGFMIENNDQRSADYEALKDVYRPSHADYTYQAKYGIRDYRGGGRSSARETATRVAAGAIAAAVIPKVQVRAFVSQVGHVSMPEITQMPSIQDIERNLVRCPDEGAAQEMAHLIARYRDQGNTVGGIVSCMVTGVPAGWGEPVFDKLHADLGKAMLSINAVKGFEIGSGFAAAAMTGSQHNDAFNPDFSTQTNHSGGIQGGISNGAPLLFRVAFKPVATIKQAQKTVTSAGEDTTLKAKGRHDPCVVPRAVPIVEAMTYLVLADHYLRQQANYKFG
jgi:chorismate synthase